MIEIIGLFASLILTNNLVVSGVKWLSFRKESNTFLRGALVVFSAIGIIATASLNGTPVDFDSLSSLGTTLLEVLALAFGSHLSYKAIKKA